MFHSQQSCEAGQCSPYFTDTGTSALLALDLYILHKCNCPIIFRLKKTENKEVSFPRSLFGTFDWDQKYSPDPFAYRHYRHQTTRFLLALPSWGHCLHSLLSSWTLTSVGNPSNADHSLAFQCSSVGKLATSTVENTTISSQRESVLISQHSQDKTNRPWLR